MPGNTILETIREIFSILASFGLALSFAFFFWGLVKFIVGGGDEVERAHGKSKIIGSVTWMVFIILVWAILAWARLTPQ